ncbi:hypothetical protein ACFQZX_01465 [Mucilaginibacter litoreus]|uniref:Uncharacterized protein n=1 Tax=Mucilaginibacter litoreus TaxID=1048221 RepID=A0ABW3AML3_9SPHI
MSSPLGMVVQYDSWWMFFFFCRKRKRTKKKPRGCASLLCKLVLLQCLYYPQSANAALMTVALGSSDYL